MKTFITKNYPNVIIEENEIKDMVNSVVWDDCDFGETIAECYSENVDSEIKARCCFKNEWFPVTHLCSINFPNIKDTLYFLYEEYNAEILKVYNSKEDALNGFNSIEPSIPIEEEMENFKKKVDSSVYVEVTEEYNNSGNYYSFNIYIYDNLVIDGVFELDEDLAEQVNSLCSLFKVMGNKPDFYLKSGLDEESANILSNYNIEKIYKESGFPSWNKSYVIVLSRYSKEIGYAFTTEIEVEIRGFQGMPRNVIDFILHDIDIDSIEEEYQEWLTD